MTVKRKFIFWTLFIFLVAGSGGFPAAAQTVRTENGRNTEDEKATDDATKKTRPRIGLVLGGGGARGAAHIGVLEVLEEMRIPIDCVSGTSMGSLVAGAYAAGVPLDEMKARIKETDWIDMFQESADADLLNYRNRNLAARFYPRLEMGVKDRKVLASEGLVAGEKIKLFFNRLVHADIVERRIEDLKMPLAIVATDLSQGDKVVFTSGSLTRAMRASMSVPGVMTPEVIDGKKLVDGGLVDNVPIDETRKLCRPDRVIAIDVGSPLLKPDEITSSVSVVAQMVNILTSQNVKASLASLGTNDIFIRPDLGTISSADFDKQFEAMARGRKAAEAARDKLAALSLDATAYAAWQAPLRAPLPPGKAVDEIRIARLKYVNPEVIKEDITSVNPGEKIDTPRLNRDLLQIYGQGDYQSVDYELLDERDKQILHVLPVEKGWGPDYLRFGMNLGSNFQDISTYNLRAAYHRTWMNPLGGEWLTAIQFGDTSQIHTEWYQPLDIDQRWFVQPTFHWERRRQAIYENNEHLADLRVRETRLGLDAGYNLGIRGQIRLGWLQRFLNPEVDVGTLDLPDNNIRLGGINLNIDADTFDKIFFPTSGWALHANIFDALHVSSADTYTSAQATLKGVTGIGNYLLRGTLRYADALNGQVPLADAFALGGFLNLSGYSTNELVGGRVAFGMLQLERQIGQMPIGLGGNLYVGASAELGRVSQRYTQTQINGWQKAFSVYLGGDTPLGPVYLGYGMAEGGHSNWYLFVGTP